MLWYPLKLLLMINPKYFKVTLMCISGLRRNCDLEYSGDLNGGEHLFHSGLIFIQDIPTHTDPKRHFRFAHQLNALLYTFFVPIIRGEGCHCHASLINKKLLGMPI